MFKDWSHQDFLSGCVVKVLGNFPQTDGGVSPYACLLVSQQSREVFHDNILVQVGEVQFWSQVNDSDHSLLPDNWLLVQKPVLNLRKDLLIGNLKTGKIQFWFLS